MGWFRSFESAARRLSFTAAADELGMTQSAVSQQIRSLETRLGVVLFHRKARGLALTDDGRRLLPDVTSALATLTRATQSFDVDRGDNILNVATSVSFAQWFLVPGLAGFQRDHPDIRLRIISTVWPDEFTNLAADVEIRFGAEENVGGGASRLIPDRLIAVKAPELDVDVERLSDVPLIAVVGISSGWGDWCMAMDLPGTPEPAVFVDAHGPAVDLARNGAGVALTSSLLAAPCLADGSLEQLGGTAIDAREGYFLATREGRAAEIFANWLRTRIDAR